jgi:hypothetical protein
VVEKYERRLRRKRPKAGGTAADMRGGFHPEDWLVVVLVWGGTILLIAIIVVVIMMN